MRDILTFSLEYESSLNKLWILYFPSCTWIAAFIQPSLPPECPLLPNSTLPVCNVAFMLKISSEVDLVGDDDDEGE